MKFPDPLGIKGFPAFESSGYYTTKAELPQGGISSLLNFLPWEFLLIKKVGNRKN
jgi:hypothetical protein